MSGVPRPQICRGDLYFERARSPHDTVELVRPHFRSLGITRVARQTDLDRLGIPCFSAVRPNSCSIALNQGKGLDEEAAIASAVMEAVEYAVAERPRVNVSRASIAELEKRRLEWWNPSRVLPIGEGLARNVSIDWVPGFRLDGQKTILVPYDAVSLSGIRRDLPLVCQNTNGLASGNSLSEAEFHAICELVERDAGTLWSLFSIEKKLDRCVNPDNLRGPLVRELVGKFERERLIIQLFDQTTDLGIPTILAVSGPRDLAFAKHFDFASGTGSDPDPTRAAIRAITEAAQTRITSISGARDDVRPALYKSEGAEEAFVLLQAQPKNFDLECRAISRRPEVLRNYVISALRHKGVADLVSVPLGAEEIGIAVVRVLSRHLEDRGVNSNWRPGPRAVSVLASAT